LACLVAPWELDWLLLLAAGTHQQTVLFLGLLHLSFEAVHALLCNSIGGPLAADCYCSVCSPGSPALRAGGQAS
jgi:hypothetical protein